MKNKFLVIVLAITFGGIVLSSCASIKAIGLEQVDMQKYFILHDVGSSTQIYHIVNNEYVKYYDTSDLYKANLVLPVGQYLITEWIPGSATQQKNIFVDRYGNRTESIGSGLYDWTSYMRIFNFEAGLWNKYSTNASEMIEVLPTEKKWLFC